jgi:hypothetical protein
MLFPSLLLFVSLFSILFSLLLIYRNSPQYLFRQDVVEHFLIFMKDIRLLDICFKIHSYIFVHCSNRIFNIFLYGLNLLHLFYMILARYWVYITIFSPIVLSWSYWYLFAFLLLITYLALIVKLIINLINLIIITCYIHYPSLLFFDPELPITNGTSKSHYSVISIHKHSHLPPLLPPPRVNTWVKGNVICGVAGLGVACGALYYYRLSALAAQQAVDLGEVNAGIRSRESYERKYPDNSRK